MHLIQRYQHHHTAPSRRSRKLFYTIRIEVRAPRPLRAPVCNLYRFDLHKKKVGILSTVRDDYESKMHFRWLDENKMFVDFNQRGVLLWKKYSRLRARTTFRSIALLNQMTRNQCRKIL